MRLEGHILEAPDGFAGEKVEVLYDPYEPTRPVHMRRPGEDEEHHLRRLDPETNARLRRTPRHVEPDEEPPKTGINYLEETPPCTPTSSD